MRRAHFIGFAASAALLTLTGVDSPTAPPHAEAQNALGDGRALDANQRIGSGGRNTRTGGLSSELAFRNAIVSGNAPSGFSFRGDVGYTSPFDFRGQLGSDDLFAFRRDAFFSGVQSVGGQGLRGVDALQFQLGLSLAGSFDAARPTPIITRTDVPGAGRIDAETISLDAGANIFDPLSTRPGALRATSEFIVGDALSPKVLGQGTRDDGSSVFTLASPLRSVSLNSTPSGVAPAQFPRPAEDEADAQRPGEEDNRVSGRVEPRKASQQIVLDALRVRAGMDAEDEEAGGVEPAPGVEEVETLEQRIERLREELESEREAEPAEGEPESDRVGRLTREALEGREAVVRDLAPAGPEGRDLFTEHMERGQELLAQDRWFEAEERFTSALMMEPRDVFAHAGRVNAQLGAGLYRSAAENLKQLIRRHPEVLAVDFDASLLPRASRLDRVTGELLDRIDRDTEFARDCALLLAYLARQHDLPEEVEAAFRAIDRITDKIGGADPIFDAARAAWLDEN